MTEEVPPQLVKETQTLLGKYIKEPPLTDKLLKKPPFRFLQDIVKSVIKETGFLGDVFTVEELSDNSSKDKDKKIAFLKKLISATQDATGASISARPSKIAAGLEVAKTLALLQSIATGIALKQAGTSVKPPVIEEKKERKKSKESGHKDPTKKSKSKKEIDDKKEDSAKVKKNKLESKDGEEKKRDKVGKEVNGDKKRDKSAKEANGDGKKRDKSAKESSEEGKKRQKSAKEGTEGGKEREKSAKELEPEKKREKSAKEVNGVEKNRNKSAKQENNKDRPSVDGPETQVQPTVLQEENKENNSVVPGNVHPLLNGEISSTTNDTSGPELLGGESSLNVLEEAKENTEPQVQSGSRKTSIDASKEKTDKENREKKEKSDKKDRSKEGSAVERKTSSRRSSSKVRPPSKNTEKTEKPIKEKQVEEEPVVLGSSEVAVAPSPKIERPQTARKAPPSARPQSLRPPSARPGAPKIRDKGEVKTEISEQENEIKVVPVITDSDQLQDDENMVTVERQALSPDLETLGSNYLDMVNKVGENEGALVAQILETKKELEETGQIIGGDANQRNVEIEWEGGRKQKKEAWGKEINKLREGIQQLTRSTNPLGKLFDFLQEDVDSMMRELKMWRETNASYSKQLENERRLTEGSLEKYRQQLAEQDSLIDQETEGLKNMKANVLANDRKIYSLITKTSIE